MKERASSVRHPPTCAGVVADGGDDGPGEPGGQAGAEDQDAADRLARGQENVMRFEHGRDGEAQREDSAAERGAERDAPQSKQYDRALPGDWVSRLSGLSCLGLRGWHTVAAVVVAVALRHFGGEGVGRIGGQRAFECGQGADAVTDGVEAGADGYPRDGAEAIDLRQQGDHVRRGS
jgi:hypothetical protein